MDDLYAAVRNHPRCSQLVDYQIDYQLGHVQSCWGWTSALPLDRRTSDRIASVLSSRVGSVRMAGVGNEQGDRTAALTAALDHAWRRFEFRLTRASQILNYYLVTAAILASAFVAALTSGFPLVAAWISLGGSLISLAAFYGGYTQIRRGREGSDALHELEKMMASHVGIEGFDRSSAVRKGPFGADTGIVTGLMFVVAVGVGIAAAVYAFSLA